MCMKKLCFLIILLALCANPASAAERKALTRGKAAIAAIVNDDVITMTDVRNRVKLYAGGAARQPNAKELEEMERQVLDRLINEKLQLQEAKKLGINIDEAQVNAGFADIAKQNNTSPEEFRERLTRAGVNLDSLYQQIRTDVAWSYVVRRKLRPQVNVSDSEIDTELDVKAKNEGKTEYHVAEIFLPVSEGTDDKQTLERAKALVKEMLAGGRFADIARKNSQSPGANAGGDIGWIREGQLDPKIDAALAQMQPGQISPPVRTEKGYYILFLRDARKGNNNAAPAAAMPAPANDATLQLRSLTMTAPQTDPENIVNAKIARMDILRTDIKNCEDAASKEGEFSSEGTGLMSDVKLSTLPAPVASAVLDLQVGQTSAPVRTAQGISVFTVCAREDMPTLAETGDDVPLPKFTQKEDATSREEVANRLGMQRLGQMQERYLRDLRATAFIDKRI